ncbi:DEKNAAC103418 [Brettanomyces naardenensis]|uniref:Ubiquitin carboxyl-terminal hydrolase n=1 Tax=Brettanomyces naardenensis TaxID=13370 RepID=A0A448YN82_BRENA|nr:DEKNAAC103418 [Brettanomyces naardenensis]
MTAIQVSVKNGGKSYPVEVDLDEPGLTFKMQIFSVTNVPPERQKVLLKGGKLQDDSDLSKFNLKPNQSIMVLGTPAEQTLVEKPKETVKFVEDLSPEDQKFSAQDQPSGLVNLGNTCYLNSSLQTLFDIKEVRDELGKLSQNSLQTSIDKTLVFHLKELFEKMDKKKQQITPLNFLSSLRLTFPQFSERGEQGFYKQQDAEEAYSQILNTIIGRFPNLRNYFEIDMKTSTKCLETDEEPTIGHEEALKLSCHINIHTNFLRDGLQSDMKEKIEKHNDILDKNCEYQITRTITRLPKYLTVHFVRFFWKRETGKKSKILRKVQFPFKLDVTDLLDESVKEDMIKARESIHKVEKMNEDERITFKKVKPSQELTAREQYAKKREELADLKKKWLDNFNKSLPEGFDSSSGENLSPLYELNAIIAHQGSSADSGHYQAFIKDPDDLDAERWYKFNDDKVTVVTKEKIQSLAGGSEGDSALILLYKGVGLS